MTYILDLTYLNEACFLSLNTNDKKYQMCLKMSQDDLKDIIGEEFYTEIESQYPAFTGQPDNYTLYTNYLKDYLAWQTYFNYLKFANVDATPSGIRTFSDENSELADDIKMYSLEKNVREQAVRYRQKLINFLNISQVNDSTKYPLWTNKCREEFSFAITSIDKSNDTVVKISRAVNNNE